MLLHRRGSAVEIHTPAKVNLFLEVLGRRADGFHEIETLMTAIDLYDSLLFEPWDEGPITLTASWAPAYAASADAANQWEELPPSADNLVVKAVEMLGRAAGVQQGASIRLLKRIPSAAGLGGGSSDAAAALTAANEAWGLRWTADRLAELAGELGSDIPFFFAAGAAVCEGRGEQVRRAALPLAMPLVIVRPPAPLSTAEVYRNCRPAEQPRRVGELLKAARSGDWSAVGRRLHNRLQEPALRLSPWISRLRREFDTLPLLGHQLSGSGTAYFGVCRSKRQARILASRLRSRRLGAVFCASTAVASRPFHLASHA